MGSAENSFLPDDKESSGGGGGNKDELNGRGSMMVNGLVSELNVNGERNEVNRSDEVLRNLHSVPYIYRQDVVRHKKSGTIGIVNEVAGDSDSDGSITDDDDDDDEDEEEELDEDAEDEGGGSRGDSDGNANDKGNSNSKIEILQADQVRVLWMDDIEPVQHVNDISVVDRGFLHGDYVASASDPTGQVGVVVDVNISVDLLAADQSIMKDVSSRDLKRVREFAVGDYVVFGPWLGRVDDVLDNVTVLVDDGSVCRVTGAEPLRLKPISKSMFDEDEHFPYYPGQRVRATSSSVFRNSRWLSGLWKANRLEGTVTKVTSGSVFIYWITSAGYGPESSTAPAEEQNPKNLKLLSCFTHASWQVGDWCLLPSSGVRSPAITLDNGLSKLGLNDSIKNELNSKEPANGCDSEEFAEESDENNEPMDLDQAVALEGNNGNGATNATLESSSCSSSTSVSKEPVHETWPLHRKKIRKVVIRRDKKARKKEEKFERALLIVNTKTTVDVAWQDGTIGHGLDSTKLIPIDSPGDHEFVAEQYVVERAYDDVDNASEARRVGVVRSVNAKERTACVRWLKPVARAEDPREFGEEEIVSVYELERHPDYDYSYGDAVVRLSPVSTSLQATSDGEAASESKQQNGPKKHSECKTGEAASSNESFMEFSDLSWVGNITGLRNGDIEVTWANGMVSTVGPQAIFVVGRDDDDDSIGAGSEVSDAAASWETVDDDEMDVVEDEQEEARVQDATSMNADAEGSIEHNDSGKNLALSLPFTALDFVTRLATGIFSLGRKNMESDCSNSKGAS